MQKNTEWQIIIISYAVTLVKIIWAWVSIYSNIGNSIISVSAI